MKKADIWMPLYIGDYLRDTMHLSRADHGTYLLLIMAYWSIQGPLPDDDEWLSAVAKVTPGEWPGVRKRIAKFFQCGDGVWKHKRIDEELANARRTQSLRSAAGKAGNEAKRAHREHKASANGHAGHTPGDPPSPSPSHIAERERGAERPSCEEVVNYAQVIGLAEWKAVDWFDEMEGGGWLDHNRRPVESWRAVLRRVKTKWEADGRPAHPPAAQGALTSKPTAFALKTQLEAIESEINAIKNRGHENAHGWIPANNEDRDKLKQLKSKAASIRQQLQNLT